MRWVFTLSAVLLSSPAFAALTLPEGGLPAGRLAVVPVVSTRQSTLGDWGILQDFMRAGGSALPGAAEIAGLDAAAGRYAAGTLVGLVPPELWAELSAKRDIDQAESGRINAAMRIYLEQAGTAASKDNVDILVRLQRELDAGRIGVDDLADAAAALRGLSAHRRSLKASLDEVSRVLERERSREISDVISNEAKTWRQGEGPEPAVQVPESFRDSGRLVPASAKGHRVGHALTVAGVALISVSAVAALHPQWGQALGEWHGIMIWAGTAFSAAGRFFGSPRGPPSRSEVASASRAPASTRWGRAREWIANRVASFRQLWQSAGRSADAQRDFEGKVGGASWPAFKNWIMGAARTALYWLPLSLLGMLGGFLFSGLFGAVAATPQISSAASTTLTPDQAHAIAGVPLLHFLNTYLVQSVLKEVVILAVVYDGLKWLFSRIPFAKHKPAFAAGLATLVPVAAFLLSFGGLTLPLAFAMVGVQAVILCAYERSGSIWVGAGMAGLFALLGLESSRMAAYLNLAAAGALVGAPAWAGLAVAGMILAVSAAAAMIGGTGIKDFFKAQLDRLKSIGEWWSKPAVDGAPKSPWPMLALGLLWALPTYLVMDFAFAGVHHFLPQSEPTPEILRRMLLMPMDVILFNFMIVAGLEEWVFRRGLFKPIVEKLKKWVSPAKSWFWPAAILSSLIFSGAHYVDWSHPLAMFGIGHSDVSGALAGAYAFTWASFIARAAGGMILAFLYARSGLLLVPMIAHFGSNVLESIGMRWGIVPFLLTAAGVLALQFFTRRPSKRRS